MPSSGTPRVDRAEDGGAPGGGDRARGAEVADAGDDDAGGAVEIVGGAGGVKYSAPTAVSALRTEVRLPAP